MVIDQARAIPRTAEDAIHVGPSYVRPGDVTLSITEGRPGRYTSTTTHVFSKDVARAVARMLLCEVNRGV